MDADVRDEGFRRLAAAVLRLAIREAAGAPSIAGRIDALAFLDPANAAFGAYCGLLDLDPQGLYERIRGLLGRENGEFGRLSTNSDAWSLGGRAYGPA